MTSPHERRGRWADALFRPSPRLSDEATTQRVRTLSVLLFSVVTLGTASGIVQLVFVPGFVQTFALMMGALAVFAGGYLLSRTRWWRIAAWLGALAPVAACVAVGLLRPDDRVWYGFMFVGVVVAAMFLSTLETALVSALAFAGVLAVVASSLGFAEPKKAVPPLMLHLVLSPVLVLATAHRNRVERLRTQALLDAQRRHEGAAQLEALGRLAGGIAHDFNGLLTVIALNAELLSQASRPAAEREMVEEVALAAQRAQVLSTQLVQFAGRKRAEGDDADLALVTVRLEPILRRLAGPRVQVNVKAPPTLRVHIQGGALEQILLNLVTNARDAMPDGGQLDLEVVRHRSGEAPGVNRALLRVRDSGHGMDAATAARAFEPFFTTKGDVGNGLGLATVRRIVEGSGGSVAVQSAPGQGTTFSVDLPLA